MVEVAVAEKTAWVTDHKARDYMDLPRRWPVNLAPDSRVVENHWCKCLGYEGDDDAINGIDTCVLRKERGDVDCQVRRPDEVTLPTMRDSILFPRYTYSDEGIYIDPHRKILMITPPVVESK